MESGSFIAMCRVCAIALPMSAACGYASAQVTTASDTPPVTRASILKELQELKAVGFDINDEAYPNSLEQSLRKLEAKHQADASGTAQGTSPPMPRPAQ
jgi:hypothetical protein